MNGTNEFQENKENQEDEAFFPKGSIAFFILMIIFFLLVWFAFYALTIARG